MAKIAYIEKRFSAPRLELVEKVNGIVDEYQADGYDLSLRQVYYVLVSRNAIPNKVNEYKRLGDIISDGRRAGLIDWDAIVDRTRMLKSKNAWGSPSEIVAASAEQYHIDLWKGQKLRVECWFEKDALAGVFGRVCTRLDVPYFACRGYPSDSEVWGAAQRMMGYVRRGQRPVVLHFGDHDPSGIDMTRDIEDRLSLFGRGFVVRGGLEIKRLALNMPQVEQYGPPPNPAKESDSRFAGYQELFGDESWELDALEPRVLAKLVSDEVQARIDPEPWAERKAQLVEERGLLQQVSRQWERIAELVESDPVLTGEDEDEDDVDIFADMDNDDEDNEGGDDP